MEENLKFSVNSTQEIKEKIPTKKALVEYLTDFPLFCKTFFKVIPKGKAPEPFVLNEAQLMLHETIKQNFKEHKKAWLVLVKARQVGYTTYSAAFTIFNCLKKGNIQCLFAGINRDDTREIAENYLLHFAECFEEAAKAVLNKDDEFIDYEASKQLEEEVDEDTLSFLASMAGTKTRLDKISFKNKSKIVFRSARNSNLGRGLSLFQAHLTEVAYWVEQGIDAIDAVIPAFADPEEAPNSLFLIESTSNGVGNAFHEMYLRTQNPNADFKLFFIPWYKFKKYKTSKPVLPLNPRVEDEVRHKQQLKEYERQISEFPEKYSYLQLTDEQKVWYVRKLSSYNENTVRMGREYPTTVEESFFSQGGGFFDYDNIKSAFKSKEEFLKLKTEQANHHRVIIGGDLAFKKDKTVFTVRQGNIVHEQVCFEAKDMGENKSAFLAAELYKLFCKQYGNPNIEMSLQRPTAAFIDASDAQALIDQPILDRVKDRIVAVPFQQRASQRTQSGKGFANVRAEMYYNMREWFLCSDPIIPYNKDLLDQLVAIQQLDRGDVIQLEKKEDLKKRLPAGPGGAKSSPDESDALALTFYLYGKDLGMKPFDPDNSSLNKVLKVISNYV